MALGADDAGGFRLREGVGGNEMSYELLSYAAPPLPGQPFASAQAEGVAQVDCGGTIETTPVDGVGHAR